MSRKIAVLLVLVLVFVSLAGCDSLPSIFTIDANENLEMASCPGDYQNWLGACMNAGYSKFTIIIRGETDRVNAESYVQSTRDDYPEFDIDVRVKVSCDDVTTLTIIDGRVVIAYRFIATCPTYKTIPAFGDQA